MGAKKDPLRPKPGKYYKYKKTVKFYIHCGVISKSNNMWGFIGETGNGKWLFFPEKDFDLMEEITKEKWSGI